MLFAGESLICSRNFIRAQEALEKCLDIAKNVLSADHVVIAQSE